MSDSQKKINFIINELRENNFKVKEFVPDDILDMYLNKLDDIKDKIFLAQLYKNYKKVKELIEQLLLTEYEKQKYFELKLKNDELDKTINFKILNEKYRFLDNIMDMITADIYIQDLIISMSDTKLKLFAKLYLRLQKMTDYFNQCIDIILKTVSYSIIYSKDGFHIYDSLLEEICNLINNGYELSDKEIDTLLFLLTASFSYEVPTFDELRRFGQEDTIVGRNFQKMVLKAKQEKDVNGLKEVILVKAYGLSLQYAKIICRWFNFDGIEITSENKDVFKMYAAIYQIVNEDNPDVLIKLYDEFTKEMNPDFDFRRIIVFENDLRKVFAHDLNKQIFKLEGKSFEEIEGIKVYDASLSFKMIVTAIGAYQANFDSPKNYSEYWNSPKIRWHGNCCSLIGNSNITMAQVRCVILGFSSMEDNMLLASGIRDLNSARVNANFNNTNVNRQRYMSADLMLSNTRIVYNELVYERRDLSSNPKSYKKNPDYIVFIEEYEDYDEKMEKYKDSPDDLEKLKKQKKIQEQRWQESLKAARDFDIPIVKINREKVIKSELSKIEDLLGNFRVSLNPSLIGEIVDKIFSNLSGLYGEHFLLQKIYFNKSNVDKVLSRIKNIIDGIEHQEIKRNLRVSLYNVLLKEREKYYDASNVRFGYFDKDIQELEKKLKSSDNNLEGENNENRK